MRLVKMVSLFCLFVTITTRLPFSQSTSAQRLPPGTVQGQEARLSGWLTMEWQCGDTQHSARFVLALDNGSSIPLDIPQTLIDSNGGATEMDLKLVHLSGRMGKDAQGSSVFNVETFERDLQIPSPRMHRFFTPDSSQPSAIKPKSVGTRKGTRPIAVLLMRFKDVAATPHPKSYYDGLIGSTAPGLRHYYLEASYNQLDINGTTVFDWSNLPGKKADYMSGGSLNFDKVIQDATKTANAAVDFTKFETVSVLVNDRWDAGIWGLGSYRWLTLDGENRMWGATIQAPNHQPSNFEHEVGHSLGLMHSSGAYSQTYDSRWDVMSVGRADSDPTYGYVGVHTIAFHKVQLGWIPNSRKVYVLPGQTQTVDFERTAKPVSTTNPLIGVVFIGGSTSHFYTVELRQKVGYDNSTALPGSGVVIHDVNLLRVGGDRLAQVVDSDSNGEPNDAGALWTAGETFKDTTNGISVKVNSIGTSSANVTITVSGTQPLPNKVINTKDSGAGSLRNALYFAQLFESTTIPFAIPTTDTGYSNGYYTVKALSSLPEIVQPGTVIDGSTQLRNNTTPGIVVDGVNAGAQATGITVYTSNNTLRNLVIGRFYYGITLYGKDSQSNRIVGSYIGTNALGSAAMGNQYGIYTAFGAQKNQIGGTGAGEGNLVSGNLISGVYIQGYPTLNNVVQNNKIGTNALGSAALPNQHGIDIAYSANKTTVQGNLISGNSAVGLSMTDVQSCVVRTNLIGTDVTGKKALTNSWGIQLYGASTANTIGGKIGTDFNIISGNAVGVGMVGAMSNTVAGNYIGTDITGKRALGNTWGFYLTDASGVPATSNLIGGATADSRNVISGNVNGALYIAKATKNSLQGNFIGLALDGTALRNGVYGLYMDAGAKYNSIGTALANTIANQSIGIYIIGSDAVGNIIRQNLIYNHTNLGIDLAGGVEDAWGVTGNDTGDADTGANSLQNYPVITKITKSAAGYTITGTLKSLPNTKITLEFFSSSNLAPSGYGEGEAVVTARNYTTDASGNASFTFALTTLTGKYLTATATNTVTGDTSEFAKSIAIP